MRGGTPGFGAARTAASLSVCFPAFRGVSEKIENYRYAASGCGWRAGPAR